MASIIQSFPKGSGKGGGHTILDTDGVAVTQEENLQFTGLSVTDDSTNGITEVAGEGLNSDSIDDIADVSSIVPAVVIGDANNYSTNEKVIGKWIDGKTLYQKVITVTIPTTTDGTLVTASVSLLSLNIGTMVRIIGFGGFTGSGTDYVYTFEGSFYTSTDRYIRCLYDKTHGEFLAQTNKASFSNTTIQVILQYTKTT